MDGGAWWAAVHGVAQSRTRLSDLAAAAAVRLMFSQKSFKLCSLVYIFFSFFYSKAVMSTTQFFSSLKGSSVSFGLLLIPSSALFIEITVSFHLPVC